MANKTANSSLQLSYIAPLGNTTQISPPLSVATPYNGLSEGTWDLPALTAPGETLTVPLGGIVVPTGFVLKNNSDADVQVEVNNDVAGVTGYVSASSGAHTLSSGTITFALSSVSGEQLSVSETTPGGTPGILSVRRSGGNVIVESWLAGTGIQTLDTSVVTVLQSGPAVTINAAGAFTMPPGGCFTMFSPVTDTPSTPITEIVLTTETEATAGGSVGYLVFGDPV
jgi:hypothetical protein